MSAECYNNKEVGRTESRLGVSRGGTVVRFFVAAVLLFAAGLKAYQLATVPSLGEGILHARWFNILVVEFEIFFAFWLISGLLPKLTWLASIALFSMFTLVSLFKAISGETSCGCFGNVTVNPWITAAFDAGIVLLLTLTKSNLSVPLHITRWKFRLSAVILFWMILTMPVVWLSLNVKTATLTKTGELTSGFRNIIMNPADWVGAKFPLLSFLDEGVAKKIMVGKTSVVLFRFDCEECKNLIETVHDKSGYIFVAIPSEGNNASLFSLPEYTSLPADREWWGETPVVFSLENAMVAGVSRSID
ncbi:hypothetical protein FACS189454_04650 [Planctomycetales bacterium]|nr:hypothetical protein FACS189454_04650 [Planctomycetales bacterium]